jgi:hypothetical protein
MTPDGFDDPTPMPLALLLGALIGGPIFAVLFLLGGVVAIASRVCLFVMNLSAQIGAAACKQAR